MGYLDFLIFFAYAFAVLALGLVVARRRESRLTFLVANRSMRWLPLGLSVMVTSFSAVNIAAFSGEVFANGLYVVLVFPALLLVVPPVLHIVIPWYRGMSAVSAYAVLEQRFGLAPRRVASALFVTWRILWMGVVLYATSRILATLTGTRAEWLVAAAALLAALYTSAGGMRSVIWTDVAQFFVMGLALAGALYTASAAHNGFAPILQLAADGGRLRPFFPFDPSMFSFDPRLRLTFWSCLVGGTTAFLARYSADQMVAQRYFAARTLSDARKAFTFSVVVLFAALSCLVLLGFAVYAYTASGEFPEAVPPVVVVARFFAWLPPGLTGLMAAGLFASTMSSIDSGLHSCTTAITEDFLSCPAGKEQEGMPLSLVRERAIVVGLAVAAAGIGCTIGRIGTVFEIANRIVNAFGGPLLALVVAARWPRPFGPRGVTAGAFAGAVFSIGFGLSVDVLALHLYAIVNFLGTLAFCRLGTVILDRPAARRSG